MFTHILYSFSNNFVANQLEKIFFKTIFCFFFGSQCISMLFNQASWLNLINVWTFLKTTAISDLITFTEGVLNGRLYFLCGVLIHDFLHLLIFLCVLHTPFLSWELATSFSTFSKFILSDKKGKLVWKSCKFSWYWTSTSKKYSS